MFGKAREEWLKGQLSLENEITAISELLNLLVLTGCIATIDAMGCQINIAEKIIEAVLVRVIDRCKRSTFASLFAWLFRQSQIS